MEDAHFTKRHLLSNKVDVQLDVFSAMMMDGVRRHVYSADVVAINDGGGGDRLMKLRKQLAHPTALSDGMSDSPVLSFHAGAGDGRLSLEGPRDEIIPEVDAVAQRRASHVGAASPVGIGVHRQGRCGGGTQRETMVEGPFDVPQNSFDEHQVWLARIMHEEARLLDCIREVGTRKRQVLQGTGETSVS